MAAAGAKDVSDRPASQPSPSFRNFLSDGLRGNSSLNLSAWANASQSFLSRSRNNSMLDLGDQDTTSIAALRHGTPEARSVFDHYEIVALIGGTENSGVYTCKKRNHNDADEPGSRKKWFSNTRHDAASETLYNMKALYVSSKGDGKDKFYDQLDRIKRFSHRNVVKLHEYFERYGRVYLITEHCQGRNLASRFPYSELDAAKIISQVLMGVKYLHDQDILHLSLNLENVLFVDPTSKKMDCKIANFGLSRKLKGRCHVNEGGEEKNYAAAPETFSAMYLPQSDVWSVGVIAFILLTRQAPFRGDDMMEQLIRGRYDFDDPEWKKISKEAKHFIRSCLELDPNKRPTASKALRHPWAMKKFQLRSKDACITVEEKVEMERVLQMVDFRREAINLIAEISSMEEIVNIAQWCFHFDEKQTGMTTIGELKLGLKTNGYSLQELTSIFSKIDAQNIGDGEQLEFRDFLAAALEARGRFEEIILSEAFERSFEEENVSMTDYELAGLLTSVSTPERVQELFPNTNWAMGDKVSFSQFLEAFHQKTREYSSKIAMDSNSSMTGAMSLLCMTMLREPALLSSGVKYKKQGILGGSEVSAIYIVKVDPSFHAGDGRSLRELRKRSFVRIEEEYALKVFQGTTPQAEYTLRKDIAQLMQLDHPSIVRVHDEFVGYGKVHMVMEACHGGNLRSRLPCTEVEAAKIVSKLLGAVKYMHERDLTHNAISMETVLYDSGDDDANPKLVNFGLSRKHLCHERITYEHEDDGSFYAASPESFRGVYTMKGDIWSIGVIAYYLITGRRPFFGKRWHQQLTNKELELDPNDLSREAITFINDMLSLDAKHRPDAANALMYRWIMKNAVFANSPKHVHDLGCQTDAEKILRIEEFKRSALNVIAQRLADDQIIELVEIYDRSSEKETPFLAFRKLLLEAGFAYVVEGIESKMTFDQEGSFLLATFLKATLAARGHILEDFYQMSFIGSNVNSSYIDRLKLTEMIESTGACVDVESIFKTAGLHEDDDMISFEEFLKVFRTLRTQEIDRRLNLKDHRPKRVSMTAVLCQSAEKQHMRQLSRDSRFRMVRRLGGTESVVFEVASKTSLDEGNQEATGWSEDFSASERFALKIFRLSRFPNSVAKRMKTELTNSVMAIKAMDHPGIVQIHSLTEHFNQIHVRQGLCQGGNIGDRIPYSETDAIGIIKQILSVVSYLHKRKVVHRAICLENVMFEKENEPVIKLISFGLSRKCLSLDEKSEEDDDWCKTYALAPECILDNAFSDSSDMWAIGVLTYIMLAGHLPFDGDCDLIREKIEYGEFDFDPSTWQAFSELSRDFISSLLDVDPSRRLDARKAARHKWLRQPEEISTVCVFDEEKTNLFRLRRRGLKFRLEATNMLAYHCTASELLDLREELRKSSPSNRKGYVSVGDFGRALEACRICFFVIARILPSFGNEDENEFEYDVFLSQVIEARGHIVEVRLAEAFESIDAQDVSRREIKLLLGSVYDSFQVDELFARLEDQIGEHERVSFHHFLRLFDRHVEWLTVQKEDKRFSLIEYRERFHSDPEIALEEHKSNGENGHPGAAKQKRPSF